METAELQGPIHQSPGEFLGGAGRWLAGTHVPIWEDILLPKSEFEELFVGMKCHISVWAVDLPWLNLPWAGNSTSLCLGFPSRTTWIWLL